MALPFPVPWQTSTLPGLSGDASATTTQAERALKGMRRSLRGWLTARKTMDAYVAGRRKPAGLLRNPGARPLPPAVAAMNLRERRFAHEQDLANTLFALLTESGFDPNSLPQANVGVEPNAAVHLAEIVIAGRTPTDVSSPSSQGFIWLVAIPVAGAVLVISQLISSKADVAKEKERLACVESGACTDSGFWLKVASIGVIAWLAWDKLGLKDKIKLK